MTGNSVRILIIEDDLTIAKNLYDYLARQGMAPDAAYDGHAGLAMLRAGPFDAVVLDLGLPGLSGLDVLRALRADATLSRPTLVLTARDRIEDKLAAFDAGAEDYLIKPFALAEVAARLRVLLRRGHHAPANETLNFRDLQYDPGTHAVTVAGRDLTLPRKSILILEALLRQNTGLVTHARLAALLWPDGPPSDKALYDQLHLLRRRLREARGPDIETLHGQGWRLTPSDAEGSV